jgi:DNA topoisomerase-1
MATKTSKAKARSGKGKADTHALVIVESPTKADTIRKYLGDGFRVEASVGHIRDLVDKKSQLSARDKRREAAWVKYGVNIENGFEPLEEIYRVPPDKKRQIDLLKRELADVDTLYLATDDDREGEAISWHLLEELKPKVPVKRLVFREITKSAIAAALADPREVDMDLVNAQRTRRIVDRLFGWDVSQVLWRKIKGGLSAGRVQSVALRLLVERERERIAFESTAYWDLRAKLEKAGDTAGPFDATLTHVGDRRVASSRDFDGTTGALKNPGVLILDETAARSLAERLLRHTPVVAKREVKPQTLRPSPPFTTSTLQQEANRKLRYSARRTMSLAQRLYEQGYITYMRTDSTRLSSQALDASRKTIRERFGTDYVPSSPRFYATKSKGAQEAHEAIRPAGESFTPPAVVRKKLDEASARLYELIWSRTLASQMKDAKVEQTSVDIQVDDARFRASGRTVVFPGYLAAVGTSRGSDEKILPTMAAGDALGWAATKEDGEASATALRAAGHSTRPPSRLNDATLVRALEERGIGRPSTYASIIQALLDRTYAFRRGGSSLVPTFLGMAVVQLLEAHMPHLVDYGFTREMEDRLDAIAQGDEAVGAYLRGFYRDGFAELGSGGGPVRGLVPLLEDVKDRIDPAVASGIEVGRREDGTALEVRIGRYGTFVRAGEQTATVPDEIAPDELTAEKIEELVATRARAEAPIGVDPDSGENVYVRNGRFGWYIQRGEQGEGLDPQRVSLSKGMEAETMTLQTALAQLALPRDLGKHPDNGEPVIAAVGRYGDFIRCGTETRSLQPGTLAAQISLDDAVALLRQPKARGGRQMLREIGKRESDGATIAIWTGRWGPYVTDGKLNKTLGEIDPAGIDMARAQVLLEEAERKKFGTLLGKHPKEKDREVRLMDGRFGAYVTDGAFNASVPKGTETEEVDLITAVELLETRGKPVKKRGRGGSRATRKPAAKKKPTKRKSTAKKATKKD